MNHFQEKRPLEILLVDDDEQEIFEIALALQEQRRAVHLQVMRSGEEALAYLHADHESQPVLPRLILIEGDHAACHGFDVLEDVKANHNLSSIPVVLFTSIDHGTLPSYYSGCCSIFPKPLSATKLGSLLQEVSGN